MSTVLAQVALPLFLGLLVGLALSPRRPATPWAHLVYGTGSIGAIWILLLNPVELPPVVTVPGLLLGGVLLGLFDVRKLTAGWRR